MAIELEDVVEAVESDDDGYIALVRAVIRRVVERQAPAVLYVVRIDNWFGERWLGFGGKLVGAVGVHPEGLTIPPFHPNRVVQQRTFQRAEGGSYSRTTDAAELHLSISSESNLRRKLRGVTESGVFVWYSGNSRVNGRGAMLVYSTAGEDSVGWYAAFEESKDWRIACQKGISPEALASLLSA